MAGTRIISGKAKGLRLKSVPSAITRPITDRVKEALFNIIGGDIVGSSFLDLFAGTGSVGLEALSRGAQFARFIEKNPRAYSILEKNLKISKLIDNADSILGDAYDYIGSGSFSETFDYLYVAPPQYYSLWSRMVHSIDTHIQHLNEFAWIISQIDPKEYEKLVLLNLYEFDKRKYGDTMVIFYSFNMSA